MEPPSIPGWFILLSGRLERVAIVASIPWALGIWWVGEGFGTLPTGFGLFAAAAPGPVLFYPLLELLAWPRRDPRGARGDPGTNGDIYFPRGARGDPGVPVSWAAGVWVGLWVGGALLLAPWRFSPGRVIQANLNEFSLGQPTGLGGIAQNAYHFAGAHPVTLTLLLAVIQAAVGVAVLYGPTRRIALTGGIVVSLIFWEIFQALGGVLAGDATDPGTGPLLILLGLALWPTARAPQRLPTGPNPRRGGHRLTCGRFAFGPLN